MILEIIVYCVIAIFEVLTLYIIFNLYVKCDNLEQWVDATYLNVQKTLQTMKDIDATGHFQTDDEVESVFKLLEETLNQMENIVEEKNI